MSRSRNEVLQPERRSDDIAEPHTGFLLSQLPLPSRFKSVRDLRPDAGEDVKQSEGSLSETPAMALAEQAHHQRDDDALGVWTGTNAGRQ